MKKLSFLLPVFLLLTACPARSALPGPATLDSLRTLPTHQKYLLLTRILARQKKQEIGKRLADVNELTRFFIENGKRNDALLLQVACFSVGTCYPLNAEQTLQWGFAIKEEAEALRDTFALATIHQRIGTYYYKYMHDHVNTFHQLWTVNQLIKQLGPERYPAYNYDTYYLARTYFDFFDYDNAIRLGKPLMRVAPDSVTDTHIFNTCLLGMSYYYLHKPAEARRHFLWGLRFVPRVFKDSPARKDIGWTGIFYGNIGLTFYEEGEYDRALPYLKKGFDLTTQTQYWNNVPVFGAKLARIHLLSNHLAEARKYAFQSVEAAHKMDTTIYPMCRFIAEPYRVVSDYYQNIGKASLALVYADSARLAETQWKQIFNTGQKYQSEVALARREFLASEQKAQAEKEHLVGLRNRLLMAILSGSLVAILYFYIQRRRFRYRRQQLEMERQWASAQLEKTRIQLNQSLPPEDLVGYGLESPLSSSQPAVLRELHHSVILTEDDWTRFVQLFEKVHPGFLDRLQLKLPELTPAETRYMVLSRLGYTYREMAAMLGVGLGAIRQYRLRVRRKLDLPGQQEVEEMALTL